MDGTAGISGIAGVMLFTSTERFPEMRRFYVEQLGLRPDAESHDRIAFSWGEAPERVRLIVGVHSHVSGTNPSPERVMVNLLTWDLERVAASMAARGVEFLQPPTAMSWGGWMATFQDPDWNTIQLLQPAP